MVEREPSPILTKTYAGVLNLQLAFILGVLNDGNYSAAYVAMRNIVLMLKKRHKEPLMNNHIRHINTLIFQARQKKTIERYDTKRKQYIGINNILKQNILSLFNDLMEQLHDGGYLEEKGVAPKYPTKKTLTWQK